MRVQMDSENRKSEGVPIMQTIYQEGGKMTSQEVMVKLENIARSKAGSIDDLQKMRENFDKLCIEIDRNDIKIARSLIEITRYNINEQEMQIGRR